MDRQDGEMYGWYSPVSCPSALRLNAAEGSQRLWQGWVKIPVRRSLFSSTWKGGRLMQASMHCLVPEILLGTQSPSHGYLGLCAPLTFLTVFLVTAHSLLWAVVSDKLAIRGYSTCVVKVSQTFCNFFPFRIMRISWLPTRTAHLHHHPLPSISWTCWLFRHQPKI